MPRWAGRGMTGAKAEVQKFVARWVREGYARATGSTRMWVCPESRGPRTPCDVPRPCSVVQDVLPGLGRDLLGVAMGPIWHLLGARHVPGSGQARFLLHLLILIGQRRKPSFREWQECAQQRRNQGHPWPGHQFS